MSACKCNWATVPFLAKIKTNTARIVPVASLPSCNTCNRKCCRAVLESDLLILTAAAVAVCVMMANKSSKIASGIRAVIGIFCLAFSACVSCAVANANKLAANAKS